MNYDYKVNEEVLIFEGGRMALGTILYPIAESDEYMVKFPEMHISKQIAIQDMAPYTTNKAKQLCALALMNRGITIRMQQDLIRKMRNELRHDFDRFGLKTRGVIEDAA